MSTDRSLQRRRWRKTSRLSRMASLQESELSIITQPSDVSDQESSLTSLMAFDPLASDDILDGYAVDDETSIDAPRSIEKPRQLASASPLQQSPVSTAEMVEESNIQVHFCETTVTEMNQILKWYSSRSVMDNDDGAGADSQAPDNSLNLQREDLPVPEHNDSYITDQDSSLTSAVALSSDLLLGDIHHEYSAGEDRHEKGLDIPYGLSASMSSLHDQKHNNIQPLSTTKAAEESKIQVHFCETTATEMNEILHWWSSKSAIDTDATADDSSLKSHEENGHSDQQASHLTGNSLVCDTPKSEACMDLSQHSHFGGRSVSSSLSVSQNHCEMTDDPLSQSDTLFPSIQDDEKENANIVHLGVADGSDQEDMRATAQEQHEEVTRLLYQTQDMAEKVASLAETSCTEEEEDEEGNETDHDDECTGPLLEVVEGWLNAPRGGIRRRRRKKLHSNIHNKSPSDQEVPSSSLLQLRWQDYAHLWFRRHRMSFETAIVRRCLVPVLPLPALLHLMNRPKLTRQLVWGTILLAMLGFPLILWLYFPQRVLAPVSVQPKLDLFLQHPYYTSELHYSLHAIRPLAGETTSTFFESDSDYDFL